jgi:Putative Ig domain
LVNAGSAYSFTPSASDPEGNALTFSIQNSPSWANFNTGTGQLSGNPTLANVGSYPNILISVSDGTLTAALPAFTITVTQPSNGGPPTISGNPPTSVNAGTAYSFTPTATDPGANALTFSIQNQPSWANFNTGTGQLSGTPASKNIGSYPNIVISVSDGTLTAALPAFTITVTQPTNGGPPTISGNPPTAVNAGTAYSFTPTATDPGGDALTFSIQNQPSWANFNTGTGQLSGTPAAANIGTYADIVISVSNGTLAASLPAFSITVNAATGDGPPTITGNPATSVNVGVTYSFTPTASDPEGHALTFSIQNEPTWMTFSTSTGQLTGTPAAANVGTYADIIISVSNGTLAASLPAFSISVNQATTGAATVTWSIPTQNTNGTPLVNLAGYNIYYGTSANSLSQSVQVANPGATSYAFTNLAAGTWYFGIVDYTTSGVESGFSNIASTTIP